MGHVADTFRDVSNRLFAARRDFTYIDSEALAKAKVSEGTLSYRDLEWRSLPLNSDTEFPSARVRSMAAERGKEA